MNYSTKPTPTALPATLPAAPRPPQPPQPPQPPPPRYVPPKLTPHGTVAGLTQDFGSSFEPDDSFGG